MRLKYLILNLLYHNDAKGELYSFTSKQIHEILNDSLKEEGCSYCWRIIYNSVHELEKEGFVKLGYRKRNAKTYYISSDGLNEMKRLESLEVKE